MPDFDPKRDDPAKHQPTAAKMAEVVKIDASLDQLLPAGRRRAPRTAPRLIPATASPAARSDSLRA